MLEVIVFVGLQGAGKSTFHAQRFAASHVLVSKDNFPNNSRPERRQRHLITEALAAAHSVVVDNTNPSRADRAGIIAVARSFQARLIGYFFLSPMAECLVRNARGTNFNDLPAWQKRGTGLYWESYRKEGYNPKLGQAVTATRRRVKMDGELPLGDDYGRFIEALLGLGPQG